MDRIPSPVSPRVMKTPRRSTRSPKGATAHLLAWKAAYELEPGLQGTVDWYRDFFRGEPE